MKRSFNLMKVSITALFCLLIIVFSKSFVHAEIVSNTKTGVSPDKEWCVNFTNKVNYDYVNSNYIYAKDSFGNSVDLNLSVNPSNEKQVIVKPKSGSYVLGKTYVLTISKDFSDQNGNKIGQDYKMQFTIKSQLVDTASFKVQVFNYGSGVIATVSVNSTTLSNASTYRVEGQDERDDNVPIGKEAAVLGNFQNVNVYFYDADGNKIGNCLVNIQKAYDSQSVQISN